MTSATTGTVSSTPEFLPSIVVGNSVTPEGDAFSDHLDREVLRPDSEDRPRSDVDKREARASDRADPARDRDDSRIERHEETEERAPARESKDRSEVSEREPSDDTADRDAPDGRDEQAAATTEEPDVTEADGIAAPEEAGDPAASPTGNAASEQAAAQIQSADGGAVSDLAVVAAATSQPILVGANPAAADAAGKDGLPRVRKSDARSAVPGLADGLAQAGAAKASQAGSAVQPGIGQANAGNNLAQQAVLTANPQLESKAGGEQGQFNNLLNSTALTSPAAQAAQPVPQPQAMPEALATGTGEFDSKGSGSVLHGTTTVAAAKTATPAAVRVPVPQGPPAAQVAFELGRIAQQGINRLSMQLHPAELGRVDVKIEVAGDGRAMAMVVVDRPETLDMLQRDSRSLERALNDAGLQADSGSLNFSLRQDPNNGQAASDGERGGEGGSGRDGPDGLGTDGEGDVLPTILSDRALDISV